MCVRVGPRYTCITLDHVSILSFNILMVKHIHVYKLASGVPSQRTVGNGYSEVLISKFHVYHFTITFTRALIL